MNLTLLFLVPVALALDVPFAVMAMRIATCLAPKALGIRLAALSIVLNLSLLVAFGLLLWLLLQSATSGMSGGESEAWGLLFALALVLLTVMAVVAPCLSLVLAWAKRTEPARP